MKKFLFCAILAPFLLANENRIATLPAQFLQLPLIVEFELFKSAESACGGSDYTRLPCLIDALKPHNGKIFTKQSGTKGRFAIIYYALNANKIATFSHNFYGKFCEFRDTLGRKQTSNLAGSGFIYILDLPFSASSSQNRAYISCGFNAQNRIVAQTTQGISVIPHSLELDFSLNDAIGGVAKNDEVAILKTQIHNINIKATARDAQGAIDVGFSENLVPLYVRFRRDNGLCESVGERVSGAVAFQNGQVRHNSLNVEFSDVASGELEIALAMNLDNDDKASGKCVNLDSSMIRESNANRESSTNPNGKIPCLAPIILRQKVDIIPHSFFATIENNGRQIYYNQHSFIPSIAFLPLARLEITALNHKNAPLRNFQSACYAKNLSAKLDDSKNNLLFINENMPDSIISRENFATNSTARVIRKISASGIKDRDLLPSDLFNSQILNLNDTILHINFAGIAQDLSEKYPQYSIKPKITNDWRIALMRGRIAFLPPTNTNENLVANPKIQYEFFCKSPTCKIVDIESVISPYTRLPSAQNAHSGWFINTAHPSNFKIQEANLILSEGLRLYSIGNIKNGIQTLALQASARGDFSAKVKQGFGADDFALFLYFAPSFINVREDLGAEVKFSIHKIPTKD